MFTLWNFSQGGERKKVSRKQEQLYNRGRLHEVTKIISTYRKVTYLHGIKLKGLKIEQNFTHVMEDVISQEKITLNVFYCRYWWWDHDLNVTYNHLLYLTRTKK